MFWKGKYRKNGREPLDLRSMKSMAASRMRSTELVWLADSTGSELAIGLGSGPVANQS